MERLKTKAKRYAGLSRFTQSTKNNRASFYWTYSKGGAGKRGGKKKGWAAGSLTNIVVGEPHEHTVHPEIAEQLLETRLGIANRRHSLQQLQSRSNEMRAFSKYISQFHFAFTASKMDPSTKKTNSFVEKTWEVISFSRNFWTHHRYDWNQNSQMVRDVILEGADEKEKWRFFGKRHQDENWRNSYINREEKWRQTKSFSIPRKHR